MKSFRILILVAAFISFAVPANAAKPETRCGWVDNPTPGNYSLWDKDGEWVIAVQGGYEAPGSDLLPDFSGDEFVDGGGPHGYACGCITGTVSPSDKQFIKITAAKQKKLKDCLGDPDLPYMQR